MTPPGARKPGPGTRDLAWFVQDLLESMDEAQVDYPTMAMVVLALREHGIEANLIEREVVFDPEAADRPHFMHGIRVARVRGRLFGPGRAESWKEMAGQLREETGNGGDYMEIGPSRRCDERGLLELNANRPEVMAVFHEKLAVARARVSGFLLGFGVDPASQGVARGPRL